MRLVLAAISILFIASCAKQGEPQVKLAARAFDKKLSLEELMHAIPNDASEEDSIRLAETFINNWLREQVVLTYAERNLTEEQKIFEKQIEDYRKSLLIYAYENQLINQKLDTLISDEEIEAYYNANSDNFQLRDYIVRVKFAVVDAGIPKMKKFRKAFLSDDPDSLTELDELCQEYKAACFSEDSIWLYFNDLLKDIPMEVYDTESFLKKNKNIEFEGENRVYFLTIKDYKLKDNVSPLSFERDNIKAIILNTRKVELLTKMRNDIFNDAIQKKDAEIMVP